MFWEGKKMSNEFSYQDYVTDKTFLDEYNSYQAKYAKQMRESDKVLVGLVSEIVAKHEPEKRKLKLLDVGCSTGNLLLHMRKLFPQLELTGGDLAESSLDECRANPELNGVAFKILDLLNLPERNEYDIITINAVLYMMEDAQFEMAIKNIAGALKQGGTMIVFDFFHPYPQDLHITEMSKSHLAGLRLRFRPMSKVEALLVSSGFAIPVFRPFTLPIDLPPSGGEGDLITYTVPAADGKKLPFRGTLFQPWCHMSATRA
ncbi:class I SAM-dependent methyltransferase [Candidatus Propionivibrio aalborgensis]|uniref:class I SAM-dependent methyltransferase n=1 Tax=Candidatus Propionivibrio aalborgensis TaxID=1860101 RepID=UPI0016479046|nr:class I SAM-dependent methyltransferase [Candidatus Propionivibrio aalborgensis]